MRAVAILVSAMIAAGAFSASAVASHDGGWRAYSGVAEPSTRWDTGRFMFQEPNDNGTATDRVYLNGFVMNDALGRYDVQLWGGTVMPVTVARFAAALGIWRDCNEDGYIGFAGAPASFGSLGVYPRALAPPNTLICPLGSPFNPINTVTNAPNAMIDEMRWIGPGAVVAPPAPPSQLCVPPSGQPVKVCAPVSPDTRVTTDAHDLNDAGARMWVDWGYPGSVHLLQQSITVDHSNAKDSDSTLAYVDSASGYRLSGALGPAWTAKPNVGACPEPPRFLGGPSPAPPLPGSCGLYPMYQVTRLVNDSRTEGTRASPLVQVFDTEQESGGRTSSPCDDGLDQTLAGRTIALPNVDPRAHPNVLVEGSIIGTADNFWRASNGATFNGQCAKAGFPVGGGGDASDDDEVHRSVADELIFVPDQRYHALDSFGFEGQPLDVAGVRGSPNSPTGVPVWNGRASWTMRPPRTGGGPLTNMHATFYADVTTVPAATLPSGIQNTHTYGVDYCPAFSTGGSSVNPATLWECSITEWEAKRIRDSRPDRAIIGDKYDLRDVDCYDNTVTSFAPGVRAGIADCTRDEH